ncbi:hypothetical protein DFR29_10965 [Tahibacter aquaticus]|uniref:Tetratricopeptide repeat protein n=1 Tax=Tahibacter aquaticus TaxID=520092 RepID=A0A4V3DLY9_9GAMM|nr:tetratricopeptide repeat protein [Tahibacter aquaticus]TDR42009.1 hypothetical protein DFR29_10965 [Tahibacter aquaticus]
MAQHPRFEPFKAAWQAADYAQALGHIEAVIADHPRVAALHWYRASCLLKLERYVQALAACTQVLLLQPDHAPALVMQVQLDGAGDEHDEEPTRAKMAVLERNAVARLQRHIAQLRRAIVLDPTLADAYFVLFQVLSQDALMRSGGSELAPPGGEADALLDRAIALAPDRIEFRLARAERLRLCAMQVSDATPEADCVVGVHGVPYRRSDLEAALGEFEYCAQLDGGSRYLVRMGMMLHELQRFDEAVAQYDRALQLLPADSPQRELILGQRRRSENNGAGEREEVAALMESMIARGDRNQDDDSVATGLLGAARAVRRGRSVAAAMEARFAESPDDLIAANIAEQILNVAYEDPPQLIHADSADFPAYQRKYAAQQHQALVAAGVRPVAYAEASGMTRTLGQRVLLGLYVDDSGGIAVDTYAMQPKWPGLLAFLWLLVTGKWKTQRMTECITCFDDDGYLITQYENSSPFVYGGRIAVERLPRGTSVASLLGRHIERVAAYQQEHLQARALKATDLATIDANWRRGQAIKHAYRRSVGYVTDSELRGLLGANFERYAGKVRQKLQELAVDRDAATRDS